VSQVVIISGPPGAGKTSVADALCQRYDRTAHIDIDVVRAMVRMGAAKPWGPEAEAERQRRLEARNVCALARNFVDALFGVFIDGVIGPLGLEIYRPLLRDIPAPVHFVVLLPTLEETLRRDHARPGSHVLSERLHIIHEDFVKAGRFAGQVIDNTALTVEETADLIMDYAARGLLLLDR
jgi:adenylate kinase family enzyme